MNASSRFVVAIHIMVMVSLSKKEPLKSDLLAESVNTNPVVIRRVLGLLKKAGLVESRSGPIGGSVLARNPKNITLRDIYESVEKEGLFYLHYSDPNQHCPIGANIQKSLRDVFSEAELKMKKVLEGIKLIEVRNDVMIDSGISKFLHLNLSIKEFQAKYEFRYGKLIEKSLSD